MSCAAPKVKEMFVLCLFEIIGNCLENKWRGRTSIYYRMVASGRRNHSVVVSLGEEKRVKSEERRVKRDQ
jgi:hypothetical protein